MRDGRGAVEKTSRRRISDEQKKTTSECGIYSSSRPAFGNRAVAPPHVQGSTTSPISRRSPQVGNRVGQWCGELWKRSASILVRSGSGEAEIRAGRRKLMPRAVTFACLTVASFHGEDATTPVLSIAALEGTRSSARLSHRPAVTSTTCDRQQRAGEKPARWRRIGHRDDSPSPYAHLRPGTKLGNPERSETSREEQGGVGDGANASHLSYSATPCARTPNGAGTTRAITTDKAQAHDREARSSIRFAARRAIRIVRGRTWGRLNDHADVPRLPGVARVPQRVVDGWR